MNDKTPKRKYKKSKPIDFLANLLSPIAKKDEYLKQYWQIGPETTRSATKALQLILQERQLVKSFLVEIRFLIGSGTYHDEKCTLPESSIRHALEIIDLFLKNKKI